MGWEALYFMICCLFSFIHSLSLCLYFLSFPLFFAAMLLSLVGLRNDSCGPCPGARAVAVLLFGC